MSQKCAQHIIVRGLVRVRCVQEMDRVLHFMTRKGLINTGVLAVKRPLLPERYRSVSVLIFTWSWSIKTATANIYTLKFFYPLYDLAYILHFIIFAEERYHHRCRSFRAGCCTAAAKLWHSGNCHTSSQTCYFTLFAGHRASPSHSPPSWVYRWWCLRRGRGLEVVCGMIPLWESLWVEELRL